MQALAEAATAYAQCENAPHPDLENVKSGLLMSEPELSSATQLQEWLKTNPAYPVFGSTVKDKDNLFARCHGTVVAKSEWRTNGLFVSDVRFVFPTSAHCQTYYEAAMVGHPELFFDADDGTMQPRMVEMQSPDKSFHVGDVCRTFCGPTAQAREKLMASVAAGKTMEELQLIAERAIKTVHLLYLFCVGRVMMKLCVTTDNGLYPLGHAQALASACKQLTERWTQGVGGASAPANRLSSQIMPPAPVYAKSDLRSCLYSRSFCVRVRSVSGDEFTHLAKSPDSGTVSLSSIGRAIEAGVCPRSRLQERAKLNVSETLATQTKDSTALRAPTESAFFPVALFVAVVGEGVLDPSTPSRVLERLQQASSKVPKEQIIRIPLRDKVAVKGASEKSKEGKDVELKLRVFVANSEDAKAVQGYIASHDEQVPAPVVVLCPMLPMAMEYDALTVDPTNQGTADRLRKQAKTRAVKLVRELLMENTDKLSSKILFGHAGPSAPVKHLAESLKRRTSVINPETKERGIVYTAGCKPVSAASAVGPAYVSAKDAEIEEEEEDDDEEEDGEYGDEYEEDQGLESLLALASKALEDAAVSSASSTPAALPSTGQWKEKGDEEGKVGGAVKEEDGDEESIRLGKRRKLPGDLVH